MRKQNTLQFKFRLFKMCKLCENLSDWDISPSYNNTIIQIAKTEIYIFLVRQRGEHTEKKK